MSPAHGRSNHGDRAFPPTAWSVVVAVGADTVVRAEDALTQLCERYWYPIYAYARARGAAPHEAEDLTQGFFAHLLATNAIKKSDRGRGRFRTFLRTAFRNYCADDYEARTREKRGGSRRRISLDISEGERRYSFEPAHELTPDKIFDRQWATTVMERALEHVRRWMTDSGREDLFDAIQPALEGYANAESSEAIADRLGSTAQAVRAAVYRARKRYAEHIRTEIAETLTEEEDVEQEVTALLEALHG